MQHHNKITLHGVFVNLLDIGVLIRGPSGIGKSDLALELIPRGHRLVADDAPEFSCDESGDIIGSCPPLLQNFLEIRGLGVIEVTALFGNDSVTRRQPLDLIIALDPSVNSARERLSKIPDYEQVLGVPIPKVTLPVTPTRNLALIVETIVRDHKLRLLGYNANNAFLDRHDIATSDPGYNDVPAQALAG